MTTLSEFLLARIAEEEQIAKGAIDPESPGVTWHWVTTQTDTPVVPGEEGMALEEQDISLRSVEEFPSYVGALPAFIIWGVDDALPGAPRHIAHWDPKRVLAECEAKREIVERSLSNTGVTVADDWPLHFLALPYSDHPDYREEWKP